MDYFTCEDVPLLSDFHKDICEVHHLETADVHKYSHGMFEVAEFPETPLLPSTVDDDSDEFSEFVQSPTSEEPPTLKVKPAAKESAEKSDSQMVTIDYIQHVAIILFVQLLIPIPFMLPMGINFTKRALKVLFFGFTIGLLGHSLVNVVQTLPSVRPLGPTSYKDLTNHIPALKDILPTYLTQLKINAIGGFVIGAVMAHVLNFFILCHTICRLARGLEPDPTTMRRAVGSSKGFQRTQRVLLDLITGVFMSPAGLAVESWWLTLWGSVAPEPLVSYWHAAILGAVGAAAVQLLLWLRRPRAAHVSENFDLSTK